MEENCTSQLEFKTKLILSVTKQMVFILKIERRKYRFHKRKDADPNIAAGPSHRGAVRSWTVRRSFSVDKAALQCSRNIACMDA